MAPAAEPAPAPVPEIIEVDDYEEPVDESLGEDDESDLPSEPADYVYEGLSQLAQLFVTEDGTPVADVLVGIRDALDKLNKILFKAVQQRAA